MMETVSVRELRQHLSRYLRRVAASERLVVTERRRPVALLGPLPEEDDILEHLIATGEATRPVGDLLDLPPPLPAREPYELTKALEEQRAERL
jgi:prevent-host-death family protein